MNAVALREMDVDGGDEWLLPGLSLPRTETFEDWRELGRRLCLGARHINWLIGDWLIDGAERFGEQARDEAQAIFRSDVARFDPIVKTCRRFPEPKRHEGLTFGHHLAVAAIEDDAEAEKVLHEAEATGATVAMVKAIVRVHSTAASLPGVVEDDDPVDTAYRRIVQAWNVAPRASRELFAESMAESHLGVIDL